MGRELKRVPLDFQWPLEKVWQGFLNPHYELSSKCWHCENGYSYEAKVLQDLWYGHSHFIPTNPHPINHPAIVRLAMRNCNYDYTQADGELDNITPKPENKQWSPTVFDAATGYPIIDNALPAIIAECRKLHSMWNSKLSCHLEQADVDALVAKRRLMDLTHTWANGEGWKLDGSKPHPTASQVNDWSLSGMGHDSSNAWIVIEARLAKANLPMTCSHCNGEARIWPEGAKEIYEAWVEQQPPKGEGYQIWETVSEGSPISPVFATAHELASYMTNRKWGGDRGSSYESWLHMIEGSGTAISMIITDDGQVSYWR